VRSVQRLFELKLHRVTQTDQLFQAGDKNTEITVFSFFATPQKYGSVE